MARPPAVAAWHAVVESRDPAGLADLLHDDVVFRSPALFAPQVGKQLTTSYLSAAMVVLGSTLQYQESWYNEHSAVLEFVANLNGKLVHGIDMMRWNDANQLIEFVVMVRPHSALEKLMELMVQELTRP
jgi:hypothetical protein